MKENGCAEEQLALLQTVLPAYLENKNLFHTSIPDLFQRDKPPPDLSTRLLPLRRRRQHIVHLFYLGFRLSTECNQWLKAGLAQARKKGQKLGRPITVGQHAAEIKALYQQGLNQSAIAKRLGIGRTSVRRLLKEMGALRG